MTGGIDTGDYIAEWLTRSLAHCSASAQDIALLSEHFERIVANERRRERARGVSALWNLNMADAQRVVEGMDDEQPPRPDRGHAGQTDAEHHAQGADGA